jgi:predicted nucleotidyltransferase
MFPSRTFTGRGLANELEMNHATCIRALNSLADMGIISRRTIGRSSVYEIPSDSVLLKDFLKPLFEKEAGLLNDLVDVLTRGFRKSLLSIYLFGSVARGEDTPQSDIDILLILRAGTDRKNIGEILERNEREVYRRYRVGINTLTYTFKEFEKMKKDRHPLIEEILAEGVLIVGKEQQFG